jgi:hypothetical protein
VPPVFAGIVYMSKTAAPKPVRAKAGGYDLASHPMNILGTFVVYVYVNKGYPMHTPLKSTSSVNPDFKQVIADTPRLLLRTDLCKAAHNPEYTQGNPPVYIPKADYA